MVNFHYYVRDQSNCITIYWLLLVKEKTFYRIIAKLWLIRSELGWCLMIYIYIYICMVICRVKSHWYQMMVFINYTFLSSCWLFFTSFTASSPSLWAEPRYVLYIFSFSSKLITYIITLSSSPPPPNSYIIRAVWFQMRRWKHWETETRTAEYQFSHG
jgi:hypothetical protein